MINVRAKTGARDLDLNSGESVSLTPDNEDDQFDLTYSSAGGAVIAFAHYAAIDGAGVNGAFDCAIFGTLLRQS